MSPNRLFRFALVLCLTYPLISCDPQCPSRLSTCRTARDQLETDLSQCQTSLGQCQATGPSVCSVAGLLHYLDNYKVERLAAGAALTIEQCSLSSRELEVLQRLDAPDGTQTSHFLELRDWDGDGIGDGLLLMTNPLSGNVQSGQVTMELNGVPASYAVRQSCLDLANALNLCGT